MEEKKLLIIEDNVKLNQLITNFLSKNNFKVKSAYTGESGIYLTKVFCPDLIILDIDMPDLSGYDVCKILRNEYHGLILFLTCYTDDENELKGLQLGADDYLKKPILPEVLMLRINKLLHLQQNKPHPPSKVVYGTLVIDFLNHHVSYQHQALELSRNEFDLLKIFVLNPGKALNRNNLYLMLKGVDYDGSDRSMDIHVSRLRQLLGDNAKRPTKIKTIWGKGYVFSPDAWEE